MKKKIKEEKDDLLDEINDLDDDVVTDDDPTPDPEPVVDDDPTPDPEPELNMVDLFQSDDPQAFKDAVSVEVVKAVSAEVNGVPDPEPVVDNDPTPDPDEITPEDD